MRSNLLKFLCAISFFSCTLSGFSAAVLAADAPVPHPAVVYLAVGTRPSTQTGLLAWEIYRQAFLIAARDGVGDSTRDESLREWPTDYQPQNMLTIKLDDRQLSIIKFDGNVLWSGTIEGADWPNNCAGIAVAAEQLSRGDFVNSLRTAGWTGNASVQNPSAALPNGVEDLLSKLDEVSQFAAIRMVHTAIRADGESSARLAALARAYANLSQLTLYHWSEEPNVYAARALLYAQRLAAADPKSKTALWTRAYAKALVGLERSAMEDLDAAGDGPDAPAWVAMLKAFCNYQTDKLSELAGASGQFAPLAHLLAYLTLENTDCEAAIMKQGQATIDSDPHCFRLLDSMRTETGPGMGAEIIRMQETGFSQMLGDELPHMPQLPNAAIDLINSLRQPGGNPLGRQTVCDSLISLGAADQDAGEPSWTALGRMIQEITFAQTWQNISFYSRSIAIDTTDEVKQVQPLIADHPLKYVIDAYPLKSDSETRAMVQGHSTELLTPVMLPIYGLACQGLNARQQTNNTGGLKVYQAIFRNFSCTSFNVQRMVRFLKGNVPDDSKYLLDWADFVNPQTPLLIVSKIKSNWDPAKATEWESSRTGDPVTMFALGEKYASLKQWPDAERCYKRYIDLSPDLRGYRALGKIYQDQKQDDKWLATMKDFLNQEDFGLQHALVQVDIAHYLLKNNQNDQALPYANDAAQTGAAWALGCATDANARVGNWDIADELVSAATHRYDDSPFKWYFWCLRTGHGKRAQATAEERTYLLSLGDKISADDADRLAVLELAENNLDAAAAALKLRAKNGGGAWPYLYQALLADEKGDAQARDAALAGAPTGNTPLQKFTVILHDAFAAGPQSKPDTDAIDAQVKRANARDHITICYLTARLMDSRGDKEGAMTYLKKCITPFTGFSQDLPLVFDALRKNNVDPLDLQRAKADDTHLFSLEP